MSNTNNTVWNPVHPMRRGNMSILVREIASVMELLQLQLLQAIMQVLEDNIGPTTFDNLTKTNAKNGSNDQKRLIFRVATAYSRHIQNLHTSETEHDESSDSDSEDLCLICGKNPITMINMPCGCKTSCSICARMQVEHQQKCSICKHHIRQERTIDSNFEVQCAACGFIWDGNAQHSECSAIERIICLPKAIPLLQKIKRDLHHGLCEYTEPDETDEFFVEYTFDLRNDWFKKLSVEIRQKYGLRFKMIEKMDGVWIRYIVQSLPSTTAHSKSN